MKKVWAAIVAVFGVILGLFFFERSKRKEAESDLQNAESEKKDAVLEQQQKDAREHTQKEIDALEAEKQKQPSNKELEDYLKKL